MRTCCLYWLDDFMRRPWVAPDGTLLTMTNLPGPETKRWVPSRKAIVVAAVRVGMLSVEEACARYRLEHFRLRRTPILS